MKKQQSVFTGDPETRFAIGSAADGFMFKRALRLPGGAGNVYEFEHAKSRTRYHGHGVRLGVFQQGMWYC